MPSSIIHCKKLSCLTTSVSPQRESIRLTSFTSEILEISSTVTLGTLYILGVLSIACPFLLANLFLRTNYCLPNSHTWGIWGCKRLVGFISACTIRGSSTTKSVVGFVIYFQRLLVKQELRLLCPICASRSQQLLQSAGFSPFRNAWRKSCIRWLFQFSIIVGCSVFGRSALVCKLTTGLNITISTQTSGVWGILHSVTF